MDSELAVATRLELVRRAIFEGDFKDGEFPDWVHEVRVAYKRQQGGPIHRAISAVCKSTESANASEQIRKYSTGDVGDENILDNPEISQSVVNGLQYCLWSIEQSGACFKAGKMACYWHLIATLAQHVRPGNAQSTRPTLEGFIEAIQKCGWIAPNDAQHTKITELHESIFNAKSKR